MGKILMFYNFSDQPFSAIPYAWKNKLGETVEILDENCKWNGQPFSFPAGHKEYMEDWKALHLAKHLIDRELEKANFKTDNEIQREKMFKKTIFEANTSSTNMAGDIFQKNLDLKNQEPETPVAPVVEPVTEPATVPAPAVPAEAAFAGLKKKAVKHS